MAEAADEEAEDRLLPFSARPAPCDRLRRRVSRINCPGGDLMRRKKATRKYIPRNEFRYNNSKQARGHPHYIFGEKNGKYKSFGLTSHPKKEYPHIELSKSPNPKNSKKQYLQTQVKSTDKKHFGLPLRGWSFASDDAGVVRHYKKQYKKRQNKKKR